MPEAHNNPFMEVEPNKLGIEYEAYKIAIENLASGEDKTVFDNESSAHAAIVLGNIFQKATEYVRIFAGDFNGAVSNYDYYLDSLKDFLKRKKPLTLIFENPPSEKTSLALKLIREHKNNNKEIVIKKLKNSKNSSRHHFTIADGRMFRLETSKENYKAFCSFNNRGLVSSLENIFYNLDSHSENI